MSATTERFPNVPRDSFWCNKMWMDRTHNGSISSDSASTSTLVDETSAETSLEDYDDNDLTNGITIKSRIPKAQQSEYNGCDFYLSPFTDTSTTYGEMPEIPLVAVSVARESRTTSKDSSFWSTLIRPRVRPVYAEPILNAERLISPRYAPLLSSSSSGSSMNSSQTKVVPMKSSMSSSSTFKSEGSPPIRRKQPSVKFAEKPTIHYDRSYNAEPEHPIRNTNSPKGGLSKLKRVVGSMIKSRGQAVPARPSISGPFPIYCMASTRNHEQTVSPARSHASLRSAGSASSASSLRTLWRRLTSPNG